MLETTARKTKKRTGSTPIFRLFERPFVYQLYYSFLFNRSTTVDRARVVRSVQLESVSWVLKGGI